MNKMKTNRTYITNKNREINTMTISQGTQRNRIENKLKTNATIGKYS